MATELNIRDEALGVGWHEFTYPRTLLDGPSEAFKRGLHSAAPLIVAAELSRLLDIAFPDEDLDYHYGCERLLELVRDRASELRGEET